ncbi:hypothetical protein QAD02_014805 [Eretmocerus hayati]|uniref:Uncharacterized protein n=1 Tax=Eretmocerus hayati TaxID=131215 RepID=A0ACC2P7E0_9HYME|nr:hypothetical protein QAD02_014805 [Eretmocerus hayati]
MQPSGGETRAGHQGCAKQHLLRRPVLAMHQDQPQGSSNLGPAESSLVAELYFLIAKFLAGGPCHNVAEALKLELERAKILPQRLDWLGNEHNQTFEELEKKYSHISAQHLLQICSRIGPVLEKEVPPCVAGAVSLLGAGRQSLLRTKEDMLRFYRNISAFSGRFSGQPFLNPPGHLKPLNIAKVLQGRENSGPLIRRDAVPSCMYKNFALHRHTLGHLSAVYCVLFDRTGKYIITGADDLLVKVWSSSDGRLLATFRGASAEIMDIAVNFDNTLLAAGSLDRILRVWCFQTMSPVAVLSGHSGMITSLNFCPTSCHGVYWMVSTSSDGSVAFWAHTKEEGSKVEFSPKPVQYHEKMRPGQSQMICASFSPGGAFMAAGSADHHVRVYLMMSEEGPKRVLEVEAHSDTVDSIQWAHTGLKFISGSKDGTANIWNFEQQQWQHKILVMHTKLTSETSQEEDTNKKAKVTMVCWDASDEWAVTAVNDCTLKVWNAKTAELVKVLRGHKDEVFVLESHPIDPRIILSTGHDGQLIIWDVLNTEPIVSFENFIEGQGAGALFDAKWSPDGTKIAVTDSHGHLMIYGFGGGTQIQKQIPKELFFHTDYRPLIRDANNYVLDEQTQTAPHLMPPPFLVDVDGNPYPPDLQRLVPGREQCHGEQLVPNIAVGASGQQEVIEGVPENRGPPRSNIDRLIEDLAQRQHIVDIEGDDDAPENREMDQDEENPLEEEQPVDPQEDASPRVVRPGAPRRVGDVEGVRQSRGNWQRESTTPWNKPILARPLNPALLETQRKYTNTMAEMEMEFYNREMHRKPTTVSTTTPDTNQSLARNRRNRTARHGYRTRATRGDEREDDDFENPDNTASSASSDEASSNDGMSSASSDSDPSSEYSDWIADHGETLEPPKRSKRKPVKKRPATPPSDSERRRSQRSKKTPLSSPAKRNAGGDVPEQYRFPDWLTETVPKKTPYYPQMGDEVIYFRQGHKRYLQIVKQRGLYQVNQSFEPWRRIILKAQELVKVVGIKYEILPPRLCCLKLALLDEHGNWTDKSFTIKYHDVQDVVDFLVLRQTFDNALKRQWDEGDRFRCFMEDSWWHGEIVSVQPETAQYPDSYYLRYKIRWDTNDLDFLSPWDLEPIDEDRLPPIEGDKVPVLPEEYREMNTYQPQPDEWPTGDREAASQRIIKGLDQVITLAIAEPFIAPVDLNAYPEYAYIIEYPIDLSTIKERFQNQFYRRISSAQFDVRYLASNAEKFNETDSQIVKQARLITDICLKIIKDAVEYDVPALYHQLLEAYHSSDTEADVEEDYDKPSTSRQRPKRTKAPPKQMKGKNVQQDWLIRCKQILETLWQNEDSEPFRHPVDNDEHPEYTNIIDNPMDLLTIKEDLSGGNYETPHAFAKDVRLIFSNSRQFNVNKRSKIWTMTNRLSNIFDDLISPVISRWKSHKNGKNKCSGPSRNAQSRRRVTNGSAKKSPSKKAKRKTKSEEDDDDGEMENIANRNGVEDEDDDQSEDYSPNKRPTRGVTSDGAGPSHLMNGHSTRSRSVRPDLRPRITAKRKVLQSGSEDNGGKSDHIESGLSASESSNAVRPMRNARLRNQHINGMTHSESDEEYEPSIRGKQSRNLRAKNFRKKTRPHRTPEKRYYQEDDEDEDEVENVQVNQLSIQEESDDSDEIPVVQVRRGRLKTIPPKRRVQPLEDDESNSDDTLTRKSHDLGSSSVGTKSRHSHRSGTKRMRYNEDTDEDDDPLDDSPGCREPSSKSRRIVGRPDYNEVSDGESSYLSGRGSSRNVQVGVSVSSRGRLRKLTAKAISALR